MTCTRIAPGRYLLERAELVSTPPRSVLVAVDGRGIWLPSACVRFDQDARIGDLVDVEMPAWLARERGLV